VPAEVAVRELAQLPKLNERQPIHICVARRRDPEPRRRMQERVDRLIGAAFTPGALGTHVPVPKARLLQKS
jgi:hypothetical protein